MKFSMPHFLSPLDQIRALALASVLASLGFLAGCASQPDSHVVAAPPPVAPTSAMTTKTTTVVTTVATSAAPAGSTIIVTRIPPGLQTEVVTAQPSPKHVWVAGYWTWHNYRYEWIAGHWELPPGSHSVWVAPSWEQHGGSYTFTEGYWD